MPGAGMSVKCLSVGILDCRGYNPEDKGLALLGMKRIVEIGATRGFAVGSRGIGIGAVLQCRSVSLEETLIGGGKERIGVRKGRRFGKLPMSGSKPP